MVGWTYMIDINILISIEERSLQPGVKHRCEGTQVGRHGVPVCDNCQQAIDNNE